MQESFGLRGSEVSRESRARVLRAYREQRRLGYAPWQAMLNVQADALRRQHHGTSAEHAMSVWDAFYASRYYKIISLKMKDSDWWWGIHLARLPE